MPLLKIQTNTDISESQSAALLERGTQLVVDELAKPRDYVQVVVQGSQSIAFGGTTESSAFVELRSLGLPDETPKALSAAICALLSDELNIPSTRTFINFFDIERANWGWNSKTFGG